MNTIEPLPLPLPLRSTSHMESIKYRPRTRIKVMVPCLKRHKVDRYGGWRTDRGLLQKRNLLTEIITWWFVGMQITVKLAAPRTD